MATVFDPMQYGLGMDRESFYDTLATEFNEYVRGMLTLDELLIRPRTAIHFCDHVRSKHLWFDLPEDVLLRTLLNRRKSPGV